MRRTTWRGPRAWWFGLFERWKGFALVFAFGARSEQIEGLATCNRLRYIRPIFGARQQKATECAKEGSHIVSQIFLSYSPQDERSASAIHAELRDDYGLSVWWDGNVSPGSDWLRGVSSALNRCDGMIDLVSPASMTSDLVKREAEHALTSERFEGRLFPLIIRPTKQVPGYFALMKVFDATENRKRGLKRVAKAIVLVQRELEFLPAGIRLGFDIVSRGDRGDVRRRCPTVIQECHWRQERTIRFANHVIGPGSTHCPRRIWRAL